MEKNYKNRNDYFRAYREKNRQMIRDITKRSMRKLRAAKKEK